ncbi:WD40 repeat domain-containing protein [Rhizobium binxianense]
MNQQAVPNITLFDLLARNWQRPAPVRHVRFNDDETLLAVVCEDGSVAFARMADNEPPEARITVDNGQTTIRPRQGKAAPLIITRVKGADRVCACRDGDFLAAGANGDLVRLSRAGEIAETVLSAAEEVQAFDHCLATGATATAIGGRLHVRPAGGASALAADPGGAPERIAFSGDGTMLAVAGAGSLTLYRVTEDLPPFLDIPLPSLPLSLGWSADGRWLALGVEGAGLCLVDVGSGRHMQLGDFPGPVRAVAWSARENALVAAGAYRIAGWSMETPPFDNNAAGALATGRAGLVLVEAVAAQPNGRLVAAGYANGQVVVAPLGGREELVVRSSGGPVTALQWTADGRHLAIGDALGNVALITFPAQLFK